MTIAYIQTRAPYIPLSVGPGRRGKYRTFPLTTTNQHLNATILENHHSGDIIVSDVMNEAANKSSVSEGMRKNAVPGGSVGTSPGSTVIISVMLCIYGSSVVASEEIDDVVIVESLVEEGIPNGVDIVMSNAFIVMI